VTTIDPGHAAHRRVRAAVLGAGSHSFRNVRPALAYAPVDVVAICDLDRGRAAAYAEGFGGCRTYTDHREMLERERLDCVLIVTGYDGTGSLLHPALAADVLRAGVSAWVEKPAVASLDDVELIRQARASGAASTFAVGLKKAFATANTAARSMIDAGTIGDVRSVTLRYAQWVPDVVAGAVERRFFLDHICHPLSVLRLLAGPIATMTYERAPNGDGIALFAMTSGAVASLHLPGNLAMHSIKERTEVSGTAGTVWIENNIRVSHARRPELGDLPPYGRTPRFADEHGMVAVWEPEFSLGQLYNKAIFLLGYVGELLHFTDAVASGRDVSIGGLDWAEEGIRVFDAFLAGPSRVATLAGPTAASTS
jgi:predicted dehydrogenase